MKHYIIDSAYTHVSTLAFIADELLTRNQLYTFYFIRLKAGHFRAIGK